MEDELKNFKFNNKTENNTETNSNNNKPTVNPRDKMKEEITKGVALNKTVVNDKTKINNCERNIISNVLAHAINQRKIELTKHDIKSNSSEDNWSSD